MLQFFIELMGILAAKLPGIVLAFYCALSLATYIAYAADKAAARNGRWRIKETTLHLLALAGGWPGALAAQRLLRHKTSKSSFQFMFWMTVAGNGSLLTALMMVQGWDLAR